MVAAQSSRYVPYDEFLVMENASDEKHEWIDGVVTAMSRGSLEHARLAMHFALEALGAMRGEGCKIFSSDAPIFIEATQRHTYADASVVCGPIATRIMHDTNGKKIGEALLNPKLIVEVLSDSTGRYDRNAKFEAYKRIPSLEECILVSQHERRIEVRTRRGGEWTTLIAGEGQTIRIHGRDVAVDHIYS